MPYTITEGTMGSRKALLEAAEVLEALDNQGELRGLVETLRLMADRKPPAGTVRVRAAVAMAADGSWSIDGHSGQSDDACGVNAASAVSWGDFTGAISFIEADVPLPVPQTIQAEVVT